MAIDYTWPAPGAVGWGTSVDNNLESMEARLNNIESTITNLGGGPGGPGSPGPQGPPGPAGPTGPAGAPGAMSMRFYVSGAWQPRPTGTSTSPIISVSVGQTNPIPSPPNPVEGDVWLY